MHNDSLDPNSINQTSLNLFQFDLTLDAESILSNSRKMSTSAPMLHHRRQKSETVELVPTKRKKPSKSNVSSTPTLLIHQVAPKDTLESIAIKYNVKLDDLKRVNKVWSNDYLFFKSRIVIPNKP